MDTAHQEFGSNANNYIILSGQRMTGTAEHCMQHGGAIHRSQVPSALKKGKKKLRSKNFKETNTVFFQPFLMHNLVM